VKKKYVVWRKGERKGRFMFNTDNQTCICDSLSTAKKITTAQRDEERWDRKTSSWLPIYENPKDFIIYEITLKAIK